MTLAKGAVVFTLASLAAWAQDYGGGLTLARAKLNVTATAAKLENFEALWRQVPKGKGGQEGAQIAFSPDGRYLFLAVGDRQRMTPAQDPNEPVGKILRLTVNQPPAIPTSAKLARPPFR